MGLFENVLRHTFLYRPYRKYKQERSNKIQQKFEEAMLPHRIAFYKTFINNDDLVFDVGANMGNRVAAFLKCNARVVAVEPQPHCASVLQSKFGNSIIVENVGLNDKPGELEMLISSDTTISSFSNEFVQKTSNRFQYSKWEEKIKVPVTTLDTLIEKHGVPAFCKIDVEGFELQVLKGLHTRIPMMSFEYCVPEMHSLLNDCLAYCQGLEPGAIYNYSTGETMSLALKEWISYPEFAEIVNTTHFSETLFGDVYVKAQ